MDFSSASREVAQLFRRGSCLLVFLLVVCPLSSGQQQNAGWGGYDFDSLTGDSRRPTLASGLTFYAVWQKATGQCVVIVGTDSIANGDIVYGAFPDFQQAKSTLNGQCSGQGAAPPKMARQAPSQAPAPAQSRAATAVQPAIPSAAPATDSAFASPVLAVPKFDNDDSTKGIFFVNLETGKAFFIDKVKGSPETVRTRTLNQDIFKLLGRNSYIAARNGQILAGPVRRGNGMVHALFLVDTTTGKMGYITNLDHRSYEGRLRYVNGSPGAGMVSDDGNFNLIMHQDSSGKTDGAILYHGTTGKSVFLHGPGALRPEVKPLPTNPLPPTGGDVSGMAIVAGSEATEAVLLADPESGTLHRVVTPKDNAWKFQVSKLPVNLFDVFQKDAAVRTPHRFVFVPLTSGSGATERALVVDVGTGEIALLDKLRKTKKLSLKKLDRNIYMRLRKIVDQPRVITAVPKLNGTGATEGAWLFDSATGRILFLDELRDPRVLRIIKVEERVR